MPSLECPLCGVSYEASKRLFSCPGCGGTLVISYSKRELPKSPGELVDIGLRSMWRYRRLLPHGDYPLTMGEGGTFLHEAPRLSEAYGLEVNRLYLKDETTNPTGSFLDRGVSAALTHAIRAGYT